MRAIKPIGSRFRKPLGICLLAATSLWFSPLLAQTVSGAGTKSCRAFLQAAEMESSQAIDSYVSWAQGFASAFNWANPGRRQVKVDHAGLLHWLLQYCTANPTEKYYEAVQSVVTLHAR